MMTIIITILRYHDGLANGLVTIFSLAALGIVGGILYFVFPKLMGRTEKPKSFKEHLKDSFEILFGGLIIGVLGLTLTLFLIIPPALFGVLIIIIGLLYSLFSYYRKKH